MALLGEPASKVLAQAAKGKLPPIIVTRFDTDKGEDLFVRDRLVREVTRAVLGDDPSVFGQSVFDAPTVSLVEVLDAAREVSLLSPRRLVLVRGSRVAAGAEAAEEGAGEAPEAGADEADAAPRGGGGRDVDAAQVAALGRYLEGAARDACILFVGCAWDARRKIHKALLEAATVADVTRPDSRTIPAWIEERVREAGGRIEAPAASALAELRGNDTLRISGEIEKLLLHAGHGRAITREAVLSLIGDGEAPTAWALVDAMADGDAARALRTLRRIMDDGEPAPVVVGAIASRLRQLIVLRDEKTAGRPNEAARKVVFPGRSVYFADALAPKAARFTPEGLLEALASLYEVDKLTKSSSIEPSALLERWLLSALKSRGFVRSSL
jgi:DNA polymerase-3 subunit delta